jgi:DNA-binding transcriptional LysR family regulator
LRLSDFADEPWVVRAHGSPPYQDAFEAMRRIAGFEPNIAFRTEDYQSLQGLVAAGVGAALAPRLSLTAQRLDGVVHSLDQPMFMRRIAAVALPGARNYPLAWRLLDVLVEVCAHGF